MPFDICTYKPIDAHSPTQKESFERLFDAIIDFTDKILQMCVSSSLRSTTSFRTFPNI